MDNYFFQIRVKQKERKIKLIYQYVSSLLQQNIYSLQKDSQAKEEAKDFKYTLLECLLQPSYFWVGLSWFLLVLDMQIKCHFLLLGILVCFNIYKGKTKEISVSTTARERLPHMQPVFLVWLWEAHVKGGEKEHRNTCACLKKQAQLHTRHASRKSATNFLSRPAIFHRETASLCPNTPTSASSPATLPLLQPFVFHSPFLPLSLFYNHYLHQHNSLRYT